MGRLLFNAITKLIEESNMDMVKLKAPANAGGVCWDGVEYPVKGGTVSVPVDAAETLRAQGYVQPSDAKADATKASEA